MAYPVRSHERLVVTTNHEKSAETIVGECRIRRVEQLNSVKRIRSFKEVLDRETEENVNESRLNNLK